MITGGHDVVRLDGTALVVAAGELLDGLAGLAGLISSVRAAGSSGGGGKMPTNMPACVSGCGRAGSQATSPLSGYLPSVALLAANLAIE